MKTYPPRARALLSGALLSLALLLAVIPARAQESAKLSRPGEYRGYSSPLYDDYLRASQYVTVRDGTRLAVDIYRPAQGGAAVDDPLPVLWTHHRYHRANVGADGVIRGIVEERPELKTLLRYGYVVAAVDVRGGGASFGVREGEFSRAEAYDAYDITEWFAAQPWCDGNVGMYGLSYLGITQYMAASTAPPHLKAIFPMMAMFDMYSFAYPGGVCHENFILKWAAGNFALDKVLRAAPVDDDPGGVLLEQAVAEHRDNWNIYTVASEQPFRDATLPGGVQPYVEFSPSTYLDAINASGVAIYTLGGWYDMYPRDAVQWFANLTVPQKLLLTPWSHNGSGEFDLIAEHLRWFDYWLKGIDNGIMDEPPITYYVMGAPPGERWRSAETWPLPEQQPTAFYFAAGPSASASSSNDGALLAEMPGAGGQDAYTVDYTTTTGRATRWTDGYGAGFGYPNMAQNDAKGLTYTSPPLEADLEVTGHPVARLWVSADAPDFDVMVYLEEVNEAGVARYITEGVLRASHRATAPAPWDWLGLPFHPGTQATTAPLPVGELALLELDLLPTSNVFKAGRRIRITITGADADTYGTPRQDPPPTLTIYRTPELPSQIVLPVIP